MRTHPRRSLTVSALTIVLAALPTIAHAAEGRLHLQAAASSSSQQAFDVDGGQVVAATASSGDVRSGTNPSTAHRQLAALNLAGVARLGRVAFDEVGCAALRAASYSSTVGTPEPGAAEPQAGTVFAVRSRLETYAKLVVVEVDLSPPTGLVVSYATMTCPADTTPPQVAPVVQGVRGDNGWYVSDVTLSWRVVDPESPVTTTTGCGVTHLVDDTAGDAFTCSATSAGGGTDVTVVVKRDATPPRVDVDVAAAYRIDAHIRIGCSATDGTAGVAAVACTDTDAPAYSLGIGTHEARAEARDHASNTAVASESYVVYVDRDGVAGLIRLLAGDAGGHLERRWMDATRSGTGARDVRPFLNYLRAQRGKAVPADAAAIIEGAVNDLAGA